MMGTTARAARKVWRADGWRGLGLAVALATALVPAFARAQATDDTATRIGRIEAQLRALQRKVFPEGAGKTFTPEITAPADAGGATPASAPPGATADLLARLDTVESQLKRLTAQSEDSQNRLTKLESRIAAAESAAPVAKPAEAAKPRATALAPAKKPSADRVAAVKAIVKPATGDAGEDEYLYGYELWNAKFYPEAQQQLQSVVQTYPHHKRISYARNLLGRAYLDEGKPGTAAQWFLQNYQADKKGDRAPDSLLYLAEAMIRLKETKRACLALKELGTTYPAAVAGRLKNEATRAKAAVTCN